MPHGTDLDRRIETARAAASIQLDMHSVLASELAAIQQELERRVSVAHQSRKGNKPWTRRFFS
jgi:hypothetical protein